MESQVTSIEAGANGVDALQVLDKLEGRIQGAIERFRTAQRERSEAEKEAARVKSLFAEKDSEIERLRAIREEQSTAADRAWLSLYDVLRDRRDGSAVATVERGMCQGCRITLPRNIIQKARNPGALVQCVSCERILVFV